MQRRRFLGLATTALVVGIAGCSSGGENGDTGGTTDSEATTDSGGNTQNDAPQSSSVAVAGAYYTADSVEAASEYVHPASDLEPNSAEYTDDFEVEFLEGEIIADNVDLQDLEDEELTLFAISESVLEDVREGEQVHLVGATFEYQFDDGSSENSQTILPATNDGDWYVLDTPAQTV